MAKFFRDNGTNTAAAFFAGGFGLWAIGAMALVANNRALGIGMVVGGIAFVVVGALALLAVYLDKGGNGAMPTTVTSVGQSGGQTAGIIQNIASSSDVPIGMDDVDETIRRLKQSGLQATLLRHARELANGAGPFDFAGEAPALAELRILGIVEFHHFPGRPTLGSVPSVHNTARDIPYLTDLGARVVQRLRASD